MPHRILLFAGGKYHDYPASAAVLVRTLAAAGIEAVHAPDASALSSLSSGKFDVVMLFTQGDYFDEPQVQTLIKFIRNGGGLVAIHSTNAAESVPFIKLIGSKFKGHARPCDFTVNISDADHPIVHRIPGFRVHDELYWIDTFSDFKPFLTAWADNTRHPLGYSRTEGKGRVVYLANGHTPAVLEQPAMRQILVRSIRYAAGENWSDKTIKCAAIGYGGAFNMGKHHLESAVKARMKPAAVCDLDEKRLATAKTDFGAKIQTYSKVEDLLSKSDAELCIIITPHNTHAPLAIQCLKSGRHIITEKPFTITVAEATRVINAARRNKKMATVFHNRRWDGDFLTIRQLVESGAIGDVFKVECYMGSHGEPRADWWRACKEISGGALHDWGAHFCDWVLQLLPHKIESVSGFFQKKLWYQSSNEDHAEATVRFDGGRIAHIEFSSISAAGKQRFRILGTHGAIEQKGWDAKDGIRLVSHKDGRSFDGIIPCQKSDWDAFYRNIADHLLLGEPLAVTPESARKVIAVIDLAEQSSQKGGVPLPLPFEQ